MQSMNLLYIEKSRLKVIEQSWNVTRQPLTPEQVRQNVAPRGDGRRSHASRSPHTTKPAAEA